MMHDYRDQNTALRRAMRKGRRQLAWSRFRQRWGGWLMMVALALCIVFVAILTAR